MPEIRLAFDGKVEMLKAIHGGGKKPESLLVSGTSGASVKMLMRGLGARKVRR